MSSGILSRAVIAVASILPLSTAAQSLPVSDGAVLLGSPRDVVSRTPYQERRHRVCEESFVCTLRFEAVPAGSRLEIRNVSCLINVEPDAYVQLASLQVLKGGGIQVMSSVLQPSFQDENLGNEATYSLNHSIFAFANSKQYFFLWFLQGQVGFSAVDCTISGELLKLS